MVRVLHVVDSLATGGLEMGLVKIIRGLDPSRFQHTVLAIRTLGALAAQLPAGSAECLGKTAPGYQFLVGELARVIGKVRPHVVHSRNWGTIETVMAGKLARRGVRLVHSEHGFETDQAEPRAKLLFRRAAYELADRVLSVSRQLRDVHAQRTGFPARNIEVIHNGVDTQRFRPDPAARARMRRELGIGDNVFCIGAVGRLQPVKDHMTLLRAASGLPDCRVVIAGDGSQMQQLREASDAATVILPGEVRDVPALLNAFDAYALPSLTEGISNSLLEAMATGLPVLATDTGGNPEVVEDGTSGRLFPVGDAASLAALLRALMAQPAERDRLGQQALSRMREQFSMDTMLGRYERLYAGLAEKNYSTRHRAETLGR